MSEPVLTWEIIFAFFNQNYILKLLIGFENSLFLLFQFIG